MSDLYPCDYCGWLCPEEQIHPVPIPGEGWRDIGLCAKCGDRLCADVKRLWAGRIDAPDQNTPERTAFTLLELLVVLAITSILLGLLLASVQRVRTVAARAACQNNLKQVSLACHNAEETLGAYPPLAGASWGWRYHSPPYQPSLGGTWALWLLPYLEQENLYRQCWRTGGPYGLGAYHIAGDYGTRIPAYECPADPSSPGGRGNTTFANATAWAVGNVVANYLALGCPNAPDPFLRLQTPQERRGIKDGLSQTLFFTERYGTCGPVIWEQGNLLGSLWADSNDRWRPLLVGHWQQTPFWGGYYAMPLPQWRPGWNRDCDPARAQSPHAGGINAAMGDGSVRRIGQGVSAGTWAALCDPRDGQVPGEVP